MDSFSEYLQERKLDTDKINAAIAMIKDFEDFLSKNEKSFENITYDDLHDYSAYLIENEKNSYDNYVNLLRFGYFSKNDQLIIASMELIDGGEMIANFSKRLFEEFGEKVRNEIFDGIEIPPLGLHPKKKPEITKKLVERFLAKFDQEKGIEFFAGGLRDKYTEWYARARESFLKSSSIDDFLKIKRQKFINDLEKHLEENTLFFTQKVDEKVIEHVKSDPTIESGIREGNVVTITKIPYMTLEYLRESDERKKRYYFCHNPWIREALIEEDQPVSPIFCNCSGGYYKDYWEGVLDQPVKVELLESVIKGDKVCKFALHLPRESMDIE
ncbi:MAG: hypothetical protein ACXADA_14655 [Candidatus Hodarchaeales archaeon]|jgi:hypothetical protein